MRLKDEDLKEIAKLIDEGWSRYQLANKYNYPNGAMYKQLGFKTLEKGLSYNNSRIYILGGKTYKNFINNFVNN